MFPSGCRLAARRLYAELDYARHFPKAYVDRVKRIVPKKIFGNRYGAPPVIFWKLPPDDYVPGTERPWEKKSHDALAKREHKHFQSLLNNKFFRKRLNPYEPIPDEKWTIFPGDMVQVMIGRDKGTKGLVSHVIREINGVFVDGLHTELKEIEGMERFTKDKMYNYTMKPLYVDKGQVQLVDPNDSEPCTATWILNKEKTDYVRISERTGYEIPLPTQAFVTYEYMSPADYIEVPGKDTPAKAVLERTYQPKLCTFESELEEQCNLKSDREYRPTYWY